ETHTNFLLPQSDGISGSEVELRVRPGDNVTLYCDMLLPNTLIVWYRNCSHVDQPHLVITRHKRVRDPKYLENFQSAFSRFTLVWNISKRTHDLLIENVTESDLGLYYCGTNTTIMEEGNQTEKEDFNRYGNVITRLSLGKNIIFFLFLYHGNWCVKTVAVKCLQNKTCVTPRWTSARDRRDQRRRKCRTLTSVPIQPSNTSRV
uniref:Ig-like domain-containing protein n=1 Tax=Esox lucius TaxID=8010 RepID=A0AAY5KPP1_ESOLU